MKIKKIKKRCLVITCTQHNYVLKEFSFKFVYYTLRVKEKALPSHRKIDLHITLGGVNAVIN